MSNRETKYKTLGDLARDIFAVRDYLRVLSQNGSEAGNKLLDIIDKASKEYLIIEDLYPKCLDDWKEDKLKELDEVKIPLCFW